mmetsp:Transcript_30602/g.30091  ORF Transcript_30602/g.30091 Transcript_30602/m.30091 type:complete len:83 (+) Transcript_30602:128-376(+)
MILRSITYQKITEGEHVMRFGDFGTTYYIIIKGKVEIRIPNPVTMKFQLRDLMIYISKNYEFIINNEESEVMFETVNMYFPE